MGCLLALTPRLALFFVWILSDWLSQAHDGFILPVLGWFILPWTTLAYAGFHASGSGVNGIEWVAVCFAFILDAVLIARGRAGLKTD